MEGGDAMNNDVIRLLTSFDAASLQTLLVVRAMADEKGVIPHDIAVIAETLQVTPATLKKRLKELDGYVKVRAGRVTTVGSAECSTFSERIAGVVAPFVEVESESFVTAQDVMRAWSMRYQIRYGDPYIWSVRSDDKSKWFALRSIASKFAAQYGDNALAVIDAIIDNYDALWKTGDYPRPTFGQLSWIGEKAAPLARMRQTCDTTSDDVGYDTLDGV
jgi:hypothetical protein